MNTNSLLVRAAFAGFPLLVVALVAGAAGYVSKSPGTKPVPELPPAADRQEAVRGVIRNVSGDQLSITTDTGAGYTFRLDAGAPVEQLAPASIAELRVGDWLNGGAVPHAQTVLALLGLVILPDPVVPP